MSSGCATSFPHALALAATFNTSLWTMVGDVVGLEGRALQNEGKGGGAVAYFAPNVNLYRCVCKRHRRNSSVAADACSTFELCINTYAPALCSLTEPACCITLLYMHTGSRAGVEGWRSRGKEGRHFMKQRTHALHSLHLHWLTQPAVLHLHPLPSLLASIGCALLFPG
jgi:hypothetical protein